MLQDTLPLRPPLHWQSSQFGLGVTSLFIYLRLFFLYASASNCIKIQLVFSRQESEKGGPNASKVRRGKRRQRQRESEEEHLSVSLYGSAK